MEEAFTSQKTGQNGYLEEWTISLKVQFLNDIRTIVTLKEIPMELIINWDQTPIKFVFVSNSTDDEKGTERIHNRRQA